jgi:hypothetical protein
MAGIYKTGLWGIAGIGLAYAGVPPEKWPLLLDQVGALSIEYGRYLLHPVLPDSMLARVSDSFLAGVGMRGAFNLALGGVRDGLYGFAVGGLDGARTGVELVEKVVDERP